MFHLYLRIVINVSQANFHGLLAYLFLFQDRLQCVTIEYIIIPKTYRTLLGMCHNPEQCFLK